MGKREQSGGKKREQTRDKKQTIVLSIVLASTMFIPAHTHPIPFTTLHWAKVHHRTIVPAIMLFEREENLLLEG
jgi:hypothetical protein